MLLDKKAVEKLAVEILAVNELAVDKLAVWYIGSVPVEHGDWSQGFFSKWTAMIYHYKLIDMNIFQQMLQLKAFFLFPMSIAIWWILSVKGSSTAKSTSRAKSVFVS